MTMMNAPSTMMTKAKKTVASIKEMTTTSTTSLLLIVLLSFDNASTGLTFYWHMKQFLIRHFITTSTKGRNLSETDNSS